MRRFVNPLMKAGIAVAIFIVAVLVAGSLTESQTVQALMERFGYFGILLVGMVTGFNILVPVPGSAFTPLFLSGGFPFVGIMIALSIGTTIADFVGFTVGKMSRSYVEKQHTFWYEKLREFSDRFRWLVLPFVFFYAAFAPIPNEVILIPLGLLGFKIRMLVVPLLLGTVVHHSVYSLLAMGVFGVWFG